MFVSRMVTDVVALLAHDMSTSLLTPSLGSRNWIPISGRPWEAQDTRKSYTWWHASYLVSWNLGRCINYRLWPRRTKCEQWHSRLEFKRSPETITLVCLPTCYDRKILQPLLTGCSFRENWNAGRIRWQRNVPGCISSCNRALLSRRPCILHISRIPFVSFPWT